LRPCPPDEILQAVFGVLEGTCLHANQLFVANEGDRRLDEVAHHRIDVAADVADLGELARFDLHERRLRQAGQAAGDLGLPDTSRPDEDDVLGRDVVTQLGWRVLATPAVAQRNGHRAFGGSLPDDVLVELSDDLAGREGSAHQSSSKVKLEFV
jgi:hypothetical protein